MVLAQLAATIWLVTSRSGLVVRKSIRCSGAVRGSSIRTSPGVLAAAGTSRTTGTSTSDFVASGLNLIPFALLHFYPLPPKAVGNNWEFEDNLIKLYTSLLKDNDNKDHKLEQGSGHGECLMIRELRRKYPCFLGLNWCFWYQNGQFKKTGYWTCINLPYCLNACFLRQKKGHSKA